MNVERLDDAGQFLAEAESLLLEDEARHNLILGIAHTIRSTPESDPDHSFWLVRRDGEAIGAALRTPPHNVAVARPRGAVALEALAEAIDDELPGVLAAVPEVDAFARAWCARWAVTARVKCDQGMHEPRCVREVPRPPGRCRRPNVGDVLF